VIGFRVFKSGQAEDNTNIENNENEVSPQQSHESILQSLFPLFPLAAESEQMFPQPQMNLPEQGPSTGDKSSNNAASSSLPNRPSNDVDLSLILGHEGALKSAAIANNVAPGGMNGGTSTNITLLPSKRTSGEFEYGGSSNMDEQVSLPKRRVTESHVIANNNVNPSPSPDLMQGHDVNPQNGAAPTLPQHHHHHVQCPLHGQASLQHNLPPLLPNSQRSSMNAPLSRGIFYHPLSGQNGPSSSSSPSQGSREILNQSAAPTSSGTRNYHNQVTVPSLRPNVRPPSQAKQYIDEKKGRDEAQDQSILDRLRNGRPLLFEEMMVLDYSLVLRAFENAGFPIFDNVQPHTGLSVETIMQHIKRENFVLTNNENPEDGENCPICLEEYEDGDEIGKLDLCVHKFHVQCIKQWLMNKNFCPICKRIALTMKNVENEAGAEVF
ncbi:E3 ubiquitin-protein ligase MBR2, partial [Mucuna pruriens]